MTTIYYWQSAAGDNHLLETHQSAINQLLSGDYPASDLEKLNTQHSSHPIYSFRLNDKARLLFTTYISQKKSYLLVLEYLPEHDYQKSRFLRKGVLRHYLDKISSAATESTSSDAIVFQPVLEKSSYPTFEASGDAPPRQCALDYFNQQFIQISSMQHATLHTPLPLMIMGAAGSGKTYVALSLLRQCIEQHDSDEPKRILYVTKSDHLVNEIKALWDAFYLPCTTQSISMTVDFMTYHQVLNQALNHALPEDENEMHLLSTWFNELRNMPYTRETLFQEFRICSAYTQDGYIALGKHQSLIDAAQRAALYQQYTNYLAYLRSHSLIDPVFCSLSSDVSAQFDCIVVDEAQNLSLVQQKNLYRLAHHATIAYCIDPHQNLIDQCATRPLLEQWHWTERGNTLPSVYLEHTYRCSYSVAAAINALLQAQHHVIGKIDKAEVSSIGIDSALSAYGNVILTDRPLKDNPAYAPILARATSVNFAVITHADLIQEASEQFNTPLVFTVDQIQGLEYHTILIYKLFSDKESIALLKTISPHLQNLQKSTSPTAHRAKDGNPYQHYAPWFHRIYTAYSRAKHTLLIFEPKLSNPNHNKLWNWMASQITDLKTSDRESPTTITSSAVEWQTERVKQTERGNLDVATRITKAQTLSASIPDRQAFATTSVSTSSARSRKKNALTTPVKTPDQLEAETILATFDQVASSFFNRNISTVSKLFFDTLIKRSSEGESKSLYQHLMASDSSHPHVKQFISIMRAKNFMHLEFVKKLLQPKFVPAFLAAEVYYFLVLTLDGKLIMGDRILFPWIVKALKKNDVAEHVAALVYERKKIHKLFEKLIPCQICTVEHLTYIFNVQNKQTGHSLLYIICKECPDLIIHVIDGYSSMIKAMFRGKWCVELTSENAGDDKNTSSLYWLAATDSGRHTLLILLELDASIFKSIPATTWTLARTREAGCHENTSPLFWLSSASNGRVFLMLLLKYRPSLFAEMSSMAWALPLTEQATNYVNTSPLYYLTTECSHTTEDEICLLQALQAHHPHIFRSIPTSAWTRALSRQTGRAQNTSPLYWLSSTDKGCRFILAFLDIFSQVEKSAWTLAVTNASKSPLCWLEESEIGESIIAQLRLPSLKPRNISMEIQSSLNTMGLFSSSSKSRSEQEDEHLVDFTSSS